MTTKTYTLEHQRLRAGSGYVACEPHQACRVVIIEITTYRRAGRRHQLKRNWRVYTGSAMTLRAQLDLDKLIGQSKPLRTSDKPRGIWGRSLTLAEYNELIERAKPAKRSSQC